MNKKSLTELFFTFLKIGLFTFGGGYAMISLIENNCVEKKKWITHDEMMDVTVITESTPGPIAINCATFVGYKHSGFLGAIIATIAVIIPSFIIIYIISKFLDNFLEIKIISDAFKGIKIAVAFLIINSALNMIQKMEMNLTQFIKYIIHILQTHNTKQIQQKVEANIIQSQKIHSLMELDLRMIQVQLLTLMDVMQVQITIDGN